MWKFLTNGANGSGPEFAKNTLYFGSTDGYIYSVDSVKGISKWKARTLGKIGHSSPLIHKDNLFICDYISDATSTAGHLYCLDKQGSMKWNFRTDNTIVATPLIRKEMAFVGSWDGYLYDVSAASKHIETEEEKSKEIFSVWKPEISIQTRQKTKQTYGKDASVSDSSNVLTYGEQGDKERFSYISSNPYESKHAYKTKKSGYK